MRIMTSLSDAGELMAAIVSFNSSIASGLIHILIADRLKALLVIFEKRFWFFLFGFTAGFGCNVNKLLAFGLFFFFDMFLYDILFECAAENTGHDIQVDAGGSGVKHEREHNKEHYLHDFLLLGLFGSCGGLHGG